MKPFYSEEMLEMICNYGRYTENIFPLAAADGVLACTGVHNIVERGGWSGGGYHIMAVRHDNVECRHPAQSSSLSFILMVLVIDPH